eukprot:3822987-Rhodomonas_salina.2
MLRRAALRPDLSHNAIGDKGAGGIARDTGLGAQGAAALRLGEALGECKALAHLSLSEVEVGDEGAGQLGDPLGRCSALRLLDLSSISIGDEGGGALARGLRHCAAFSGPELSADWCRGCHGEALSGGAQAHWQALQSAQRWLAWHWAATRWGRRERCGSQKCWDGAPAHASTGLRWT